MLLNTDTVVEVTPKVPRILDKDGRAALRYHAVAPNTSCTRKRLTATQAASGEHTKMSFTFESGV